MIGEAPAGSRFALSFNGSSYGLDKALERLSTDAKTGPELVDFILAGVGMDEVGSASGVLQAVQQLASALGVAVLGTIFFSAFAGHAATHALAITAWACLVPLAAAFALIFRLPMQAREPQS